MRIRLGELRRIIREEIGGQWTEGGEVEVTAEDADGNPVVVTANVHLSPGAREVDGYEVISVSPDGWEGTIDPWTFESGLEGAAEATFKERLRDAAIEQWEPVAGDEREWDDPNMGGIDRHEDFTEAKLHQTRSGKKK